MLWAFAGGLAAAAAVLALAPLAAPRPAAVASGPAVPEHVADVAARVELVERRMATLEAQAHAAAAPADAEVSRAMLRQEIDRLEHRLRQERERDLDYVLQSITAAEMRTGVWIDQTQEVLNLLALSQDPRFRER
jgi:hypothetical protein